MGKYRRPPLKESEVKRRIDGAYEIMDKYHNLTSKGSKDVLGIKLHTLRSTLTKHMDLEKLRETYRKRRTLIYINELVKHDGIWTETAEALNMHPSVLMQNLSKQKINTLKLRELFKQGKLQKIYADPVLSEFVINLYNSDGQWRQMAKKMRTTTTIIKKRLGDLDIDPIEIDALFLF